MDALWANASGRLSTQILNEFYVVVTKKLSPGLPVDDARMDVRNLAAWHPLAVDTPLIEAAWSLQDATPLSFWDALVVAAANRLSCGHLLSEELQDGQRFGPTTVVNPFRHAPSEILAG